MPITISNEQREALFAVIVVDFKDSADLQRAIEEGDAEASFRIGRRFQESLRLVLEGGIGYGRVEDGVIDLTIPPAELRPMVLHIRDNLILLSETLRREEEADGRDAEREEVDLAQQACDHVLAQIEAQEGGAANGGRPG
jgi:hypothetical protein